MIIPTCSATLFFGFSNKFSCGATFARLVHERPQSLTLPVSALHATLSSQSNTPLSDHHSIQIGISLALIKVRLMPLKTFTFRLARHYSILLPSTQ
jgi:hypothetical protein